MTPKEKAIELVDKYMPHIAGADRYNTTLGLYDKSISKECALIAVDEIIKSKPMFPIDLTQPLAYWEEVKKEIEKL